MPIGINGGNQLNVYLFESVLVLAPDNADGSTTAVSLGIHPLWVAPSSIQYTDATRSPVTKNMAGSLRVLGGRNLRQVAMSGTFGVEYRGIGVNGGDGELRRRRFEKEVVRLSDAVTKDDIQEVINLFGTEVGADLAENRRLASSLAILDGLESESYFAVNLYDFYSRNFWQVSIPSFTQTRQFTRGGASGMVWYNLAVQEVGPLLDTAGRPEKLLALLDVTATAADLLSVLDDITLDNAVEAAALVAAIPINFSAITPISTAAAKAIRLMGPGGKLARQEGRDATIDTTTAQLATLFGDVTNAIAEIRTAVAAVKASGPANFESVKGNIPFETSAYTTYQPYTTAFETTVSLLDVQDSLEFQPVLGCFYGMGRDDYKSFVEAGGELGKTAPDIRYTVEHVVGPTDSGTSLSRQYGVTWADICAFNEVTPDEALIPETVLLIPQRRARGPAGIAGLEVFDSHAGRSVLGKDVDMRLIADASGGLATVEGAECLAQGLTMLAEKFAGTALAGSNEIPGEVRSAFLTERWRRLLAMDGRVLAVTQITIQDNGTGTGPAIVANVTARGGVALGVEV